MELRLKAPRTSRKLSFATALLLNRMRPYLEAALMLVERRVKKKLSGEVLNVRTGALRSSIMWTVRRRPKALIGRIGSNLVYAAIHEFGGTIYPVRARYLTIPFPGVKGRARDYENTFIAKNIIFQRLGNRIRPLFVLKESVTIPARPYLRPAVEESKDRIRKLLIAGLNRELSRLLKDA